MHEIPALGTPPPDLSQGARRCTHWVLRASPAAGL